MKDFHPILQKYFEEIKKLNPKHFFVFKEGSVRLNGVLEEFPFSFKESPYRVVEAIDSHFKELQKKGVKIDLPNVKNYMP